jgi:UPF0716 family protein affecting phage T7 exclusion
VYQRLETRSTTGFLTSPAAILIWLPFVAQLYANLLPVRPCLSKRAVAKAFQQRSNLFQSTLFGIEPNNVICAR